MQHTGDLGQGRDVNVDGKRRKKAGKRDGEDDKQLGPLRESTVRLRVVRLCALFLNRYCIGRLLERSVVWDAGMIGLVHFDLVDTAAVGVGC